MKPILLIIGIFFMHSLVRAQADAQTIKDIETVCNYYLIGGTNRDSVMYSKAFLPEGHLRYMQNDTVMNISLKDFAARMRNGGVKQDRKTSIDRIEVFGNAATAKLTIEYPTFYYHDMMSLLKTKDGWKIVTKIFYREDKKK